MIFCILVAAFGGICLLYFYHLNKNRKIERYYFRENKYIFGILQFALAILTISTVMNSRHIASEAMKLIMQKVFKLKGGNML